MGDGCAVESTTGISNSNNNNNKKKNKKKKSRGGSKKKMTHEQVLAFKLVSEWVFLDHPSASSSSSSSCVVDDFGVQKPLGRGGEKLLFELHSHSKFSDGFFSPSKVVERAHLNGVSFNVLSSIILLKLVFFMLSLIGKYYLFLAASYLSIRQKQNKILSEFIYSAE